MKHSSVCQGIIFPITMKEPYMLYPQSNEHPQLIDLSGFWDFRIDPENIGQGFSWHRSFIVERYISVSVS